MSFARLTLILLLMFATPAGAVLVGVDVRGVEGELRDNVRKRLGIVTVQGESDVPDSHVAWLHRKAEDQIRAALEPFGYYGVTVTSRLEETKDGLRAVYEISKGSPVRVTELALELEGEGSGDRTLQGAIETFPLKKGDVLDHRLYESGKRTIANLLAERGYFEAELETHRVGVEPDAGSAEIRLHWKTGRRYAMGPVQFDGGQFSEDFMMRFVSFERGQPFEQDKLVELQRSLLDTDYFAHVGVQAVRESAEDGQVPVRVTLAARKRDVYSAGVGYGTDSGLSVQAGYRRRWVNQRGHRFRSEAVVAQRRKDLSLQYGIPVHRDNIREYAIGLDVMDEETDNVERTGAVASVSQSATWHGWDRVLSINLLRERFQLGPEAERDALEGKQDAKVLYPMLRLSKSDYDDPVIPAEGWRLDGYLRGGTESLVSDTSFVQVGLGARLIVPAWRRDRVLLRGEAATTWSGDFEDLPASLRYFAGGDRNLRGFGYQELGPENDRGEVIGGKHLLLGSVEYEHMLTEKWGVATFVDAGNAFNDTDFDAEVGTGIGVRWRSPVGTVRLDVAAAVTEPGDPVRFHLVIGPDL